MIPEIEVMIICNGKIAYNHYKFMLQRKGVNISGVADPDVALHFFKTNLIIGKPFDLILLDYLFQHINGFQVAKKIHQMYPDILCMLLPSRLLYEDDIQKEFNDYILKPDVSSDRLIDSLQLKKLKKQQEIIYADK